MNRTNLFTRIRFNLHKSWHPEAADVAVNYQKQVFVFKTGQYTWWMLKGKQKRIRGKWRMRKALKFACYHHSRVQECFIISVWQIGRWPSKTVKKIFIFSLFKSDSIFFSEVSINPESNRICFPSTLSCTMIDFYPIRSTPMVWFPTKKKSSRQLLWGALLCGGIQCFDPSLAHPERFTQGITTTPGVVTAPCFGEIPRDLKLGERG